MLENLTFSDNGTKTKLDEVKEDVFQHYHDNLYAANLAIKSKNQLCGHYFRVLYQLLKFVFMNIPNGTNTRVFDANNIKNDQLSDNEKMYSNIVRSFLGYDITELLSINCYCDSQTDTYWKYKCLIERYSFLEHMPFEESSRSRAILEETINFYGDRTFGDNEYVREYQAGRGNTPHPAA